MREMTVAAALVIALPVLVFFMLGALLVVGGAIHHDLQQLIEASKAAQCGRAF